MTLPLPYLSWDGEQKESITEFVKEQTSEDNGEEHMFSFRLFLVGFSNIRVKAHFCCWRI